MLKLCKECDHGGRKMKLRYIGLVIIAVTSLGLSGCTPGKNQATKEQLVEGTSTEPALYTLEEQREVLQKYPEFYSFTELSEKRGHEWGTYVVPGLVRTETMVLDNQGHPAASHEMDPQGVTTTEDYLLISAYSRDKKHNSVIYVLDKHSHAYIKTIVLQGRPHVGGITYDSKAKNIWVCSFSSENQAQIVSIPLKTIEEYQFTDAYQPIEYEQEVNLKDIKKASFISYHDNAMYVGYFSKKHEGIIEKFLMDEQGQLIEGANERQVLTVTTAEESPDEIEKVTRGIQGMTFYKDYLLLSQSYGPESSKILVFRDTGNDQVFLDKEVLMTIEAPPYLEQILVEGDHLYTLFESGTKKYRDNPTIVRVDRVLKLNLDKMDVFHEE